MYSTFFFAFGTFELLKKGSIFVLHFSEYKYVRVKIQYWKILNFTQYCMNAR